MARFILYSAWGYNFGGALKIRRNSSVAKNKNPSYLNIAGSKNLFWLKECGWEDQLRLHAKDVVREKGLERIKLEELTKEITPKVVKGWVAKSS